MKEKLGFTDLVEGLLLLRERSLISNELMFNILTQVIANNYHVGYSSDFIQRYMKPKEEDK